MKLALKPENLAQLVLLIRGEKVMLDVDLARLYGVSTKALNQAFRRNKRRFPSDFAFQLSKEESDHLRSQNVTTSPTMADLRSQFVTSSCRSVVLLALIPTISATSQWAEEPPPVLWGSRASG